MKVNLNIINRVSLMNILPKEGNYITISRVSKFSDELLLEDDEIKKYVNSDGATFNKSALDNFKEFSIGETVLDVIVKELKSIDEANKLTASTSALYEIFIEKKAENKDK